MVELDIPDELKERTEKLRMQRGYGIKLDLTPEQKQRWIDHRNRKPMPRRIPETTRNEIKKALQSGDSINRICIEAKVSYQLVSEIRKELINTR